MQNGKSIPIHATNIIEAIEEGTVRTVVILYDKGVFDFDRSDERSKRGRIYGILTNKSFGINMSSEWAWKWLYKLGVE